MADGSLEFEVKAQTKDVGQGVAQLTSQLEDALINATELRDQFVNASTAVKKTAAEAKALKQILDGMRAQSAGDNRAKQSILNIPSVNHGTLRDDQIVNFHVSALKTSINTTTQQVQARLIEESTKATERLLKTTAAAIQARLTKSVTDVEALTRVFNDPRSVSGVIGQRLVSEGKRTERYGGVTSYADFKAKEQADKDAAAAEREAERARIKAERAQAKADRDAERAQAKADRGANAADMRHQRDAERRAYQSSPEGIASGFENRIRIFADYATIGAAILSIRQLLGAVNELDDGLIRFQAITQTTDKEMGTFKGQLLDLGAASRFSLKDLTEVATTLGQTGLSAAEVAKTLPSVINLATASGSSLKESTDLLTTALGSYNLQAEKAPDIANTITTALNKTRLTVTQLGQGLSYAANIANETGISFTELTAVLAGLAQGGIKSGSTAGTGTRQLIQELISPSDKLKALLKDLGIGLNDIDIRANGLIGVLENLTSKGFGSAEALKSLDLRAASAFTTLTSRLDRVKALQESMQLSNAAAEGAAKASESLTAVWTALGNKAVSLTDRGLSPMVEALKALGIGLGVVADAANKLGPVLPILGTLGIAGATGAAGAWAINVARGLASLTAGFISSATAAGTLNVSLAALAANPIGIALGLATATAGAIAGVAAFSGPSPLQKRIDDAQTSLNDFMSQQQQTETTLSTLDKTIGDLIDKQNKLNNDGFARREAILQAQKDFSNFGLNVQLSTTTVTELITALRSLRGELSQTLPANFALQRETLKTKLGLDIKSADVQDTGAAGRVLSGAGLGASFQRSGNEQELRRLLRGSDLDSVLSFLFANSSSLNLSDVRGTYGALGGALSSQLNATRTSGGDTKLLESLLNEFNAKVGRLSGLQGTQVDVDQATRNGRVADLQRDPRFNALQGRLEDSIGLSQRGLADLQGSQDSPVAKLARLERLRAEITARVNEDAYQVATVSQDLQQEGKNPDDVKIAFKKLKDDLAKIRVFALDQVGDVEKAARPLQELVNSASQRTNSAALSLAQKRSRNAVNVKDLDQIQSEVVSLIEKGRDLEIEKVQIQAGFNKELNDSQREAVSQIKEKAEENVKSAEETMSQLRKSIIDRLLAREGETIKAEQDALQKHITELTRELNRPGTTADRARTLVEELNKLFEQLTGIVRSGATVGASRDLLKDGGPVATQIGRQAPQDRLSYLLALANAESGFNPNARNGKHSGLFQFSPSTFQENGGGNIFSVEDQVRNVLTLLSKDLAAFETRFGRAPSDRELYTLHQQGQRGGLDLLDPANAGRRAADIVGKDAVFNSGNKNPDILARDFVQLVEEWFDKKTPKLAAEVEGQGAITRSAREAASAVVDRKDFLEKLVRDRQANAADERALQTAQTTLKSTFDSQQVQNLVAGMIGSLKGLMEREIADYRANPANTDKEAGQQAADIEEIRRKYSERTQDTIIKNADLISQRIVEEQKRIVDNLQLQAREQELYPGRYSGGEIASTKQQLYDAERKLGVETQLVAKRREQQLVEQQIAAARSIGLLDEDKITALKTKQAALEKEIEILQGRKTTQQLSSTPGTVGKAFSAGSQMFFQSAGLVNAQGEWKDFNQQISEMWAQSMSSMSSSLSQLFTNLASGTIKGKEAFRQFAQSVIQSMMQILSTALANQVLAGLFGGGAIAGGTPGGGLVGDALGGIKSFLGFSLGGPVRYYATGGANATRDSIPAMLTPGEYVLRKSAVDAIGRDRLAQLNAMGPSRISQSSNQQDAQPAQPSVTNIWVVSPDQVPPPSERDIVVTVARDIQNKGALRTLIRSVAAGAA